MKRFFLSGLLMAAALLGSTARATSPVPELVPRLPVPSVAATAQAFVPVGAQVVQRLSLPGWDAQTAPGAEALLVQRGERQALLLGARTANGQFEAWEWARFMNCRYCQDDPTAGWTVSMSVRGAVLTVRAESASVAELTSHQATWRLRGLLPGDARHPGFELIGLDLRTEARIQGRGARESTNLITGAYELVEGSVDGQGRFRALNTTRRQLPAAPRPMASAVESAF